MRRRQFMGMLAGVTAARTTGAAGTKAFPVGPASSLTATESGQIEQMLFGVDYALSNEDAAYYQRHLEGRGVTFEQLNDVTLDRLSGARALVVTTPARRR